MRFRGAVLIAAMLALAVSPALIAMASPAAGDPATRSSSAPTTPDLGRPRSTLNQAHPSYQYVFSSSENPRLAAATGWNLLDVGSKWGADRLPTGTKGLIWVGDYDNRTCSFSISDSELRLKVSKMAHDSRIAGYFFSDEPNPQACPHAPKQHRLRSSLIHSLDPGKPTILLMDSNSGRASLNQMPLWLGASDYVALDPYPCYQGEPCRYSWIDAVIKAADRTGLHYWGVVQAFNDETWRWPKPTELRHMLAQWAHSKASGQMTFSMSWAGNKLSSQPALLRVLRTYNHRANTGRVRPASARRTSGAPSAVHEVHYTITGPRSVAFSWTGKATTIRYGLTKGYSSTVRATSASPAPISSAEPFWEARLAALKPSTRYHYSIGGSADRRFTTAPRGPFRFDVEADVGASISWGGVAATQRQIALDKPAFVLVVGDLTYGNDTSQADVDQHFNDVMAWSREAAYMPAWGNHEWDKPTDDLRNYKGRFVIPHGQAAAGAPSRGCCGEDWGWFDAGGVRFISYPEPYASETWPDWQANATAIFAAAQASPAINYIVTFGHRPAYSTGNHAGDTTLAKILGTFGNRFPKYVLNFNGHSHDYERFQPIDHVTHITAAGGGSSLEPPWSGTDARTAYRAMHLEHVRVDVTASGLRIQAICGPPTSHDLNSCRVGDVIDSVTIGRRSS